MSETKYYEGPVRAGMVFRRGTNEFRPDGRRGRHGEFLDAGGLGYSEANLRGMFSPVRPADDDAAAWALFLPDGPLPDSGPKVFKVGQVWADWTTSAGAVAGVWRVSGVEGKRMRCDWLAGSVADDIYSSDLVAKHAVLLFDAPEAPVENGQTFARAMAQAAAANQFAAVTPHREPVHPWARFEKAGKPPWPHPRDWLCSGDYFSCSLPAAYGRPAGTLVFGQPSGACEACAQAAGVFGPADATRELPPGLPVPTVDAYPGLTATLRLAAQKAALEKPCPACNGVPFDTRRCPRCGLASKAEPVRVRLAPVGACIGPLAVHGAPALRVVALARGRGKALPFCDPCYLHVEREIAAGHLVRDEERAKWVGLTARVGTAPQSLGSGAGIGIWTSRGMRR